MNGEPTARASASDRVRVVVDTNVWVSALINLNGAPAQIRYAWYADKFTVVISLPLLEELADVLSRPRIVKRFNLRSEDVQEFLTTLSATATIIEITGKIKECRDPDDDAVLETAIIGNALFSQSR